MVARGQVTRRAAALCGTAALATALSTLPASAHETSLSVGANTATVSSDHTTVTVCDNEDDGNAVYAQIGGNPLGGVPDQYFDTFDGACSTRTVTRPYVLLWGFCEVRGPCEFGLL